MPKQPKGLRKGPFNPNKPEQLQMLMTPSEIKSSINFSVDQNPGESMGAVWNSKRQHNVSDRNRVGDAALLPRVAKNGVSVPVILQHEQFVYKGPGGTRSHPIGMGNGHHRVEAAEQVHEERKTLTGDKSLQEPHIPVIHDHDYMGDNHRMSTSFPRAYASGHYGT